MKTIATNEAIENIRTYLSSDNAYPYFVVVNGSKEYGLIMNKFASLKKIRISSYCNADSYPNIDSFCDSIANTSGKDCLVLGIGEYITCGGNTDVLNRIKNMISPHTVVLCRGIRQEISRMNSSDKKFNARRFCCIESELDYSIIATDYTIEKHVNEGYKSLLMCLEDGKMGDIYVRTSLDINPSRAIRTPYDAIRAKNPHFDIPESSLDENLWEEFYHDDDLSGIYELLDWRTFLKLKLDPPQHNSYLRAVIDASTDYLSYKKNTYELILSYPTRSKEYKTFYPLRKELLKNESGMEINSYLVKTKQKDLNRLFYLTDNTEEERYEIVKEIAASDAIPKELVDIYPELSDYLCQYPFTCSNGELFTEYFDQYKKNKLLNKITPEFLDKVIDYSIDGNRKYNVLPTRGSLVEKLDNEKNELIWIDALGVEYLGYIQRKCANLGLKLEVKIGRSVLPSLTDINKAFYDDWKGPKQQTKRLDEIKHKGESRFNYEGDGKLPIHIVAELEVINEALRRAKQELLQEKVRKVVIASDHGASRLAVINEHENKHALSDTTGKHSGRCCPQSETDERPESATAENGFWVLANYDRFKGGRKASVEVHGGATLEEVLVPVIVLTLVDSGITLENLTPTVWSSYDENPVLEVFCASKIDVLKLRVNNVTYEATKITDVKYKFVLTEHKSSGTYFAEVLDSDTIIGNIEFDIQKRSGSKNKKAEDDFFI